ncbi:MAG: DUF1559 domain-containing protein [Planctomycetaceae bacterium]
MRHSLLKFSLGVALITLPGCGSDSDEVETTSAASSTVENVQDEESQPVESVQNLSDSESLTESKPETKPESKVVSAGETLRIEEQKIAPIGDGKVEEIKTDYEVVLANCDHHTENPLVGKKYFILFRQRSGGGYITTGELTAAPQGKRATIKLHQGLEEITTDHVVLLFRPEHVSDEFINQFTATVPVSDPQPVNEGQEAPTLEEERLAAIKSASFNNIKQILLALHIYHGEHGCFPPGVIYGPDEKPWHSWRTLILPYLEQNELYDMYDFTQPWDSESNKELLQTKLAVYHDPIHENNSEPFAHYAAAVGPDTVLNRVDFDGTQEGFEKALSQGVSIREITDGTSVTVVIASVSPEQKILWTEPRDVFLFDGLPELNSPTGFATPYVNQNGSKMLAGNCDGSATSFSAEFLTPENLTALLSKSGGDQVSSAEDTALAQPASQSPQVILELKADGENSTARFLLE